jgi:chromosomal replication initiation ATPase DnaA
MTNDYDSVYSRVSQYVFVPTKDDTFTLLDQHADTLEGDVKPPLVIVGSEGSGKSALLANWVAKRREHKHRDEFLFNHFVGCSSQSLQVIKQSCLYISLSIISYPIF